MKSATFLFACLSALSVVALTGCGDNPTIHHHTPPQDPPDYHGVPTDTRPPQMIDGPVAPQ